MKKLVTTFKVFAVLSVLTLNSCRNESSEMNQQETVQSKVTVADLKKEIDRKFYTGSEQIDEMLKKVKGKWALVSRHDPKKVLQYYHGSGHPSKEWVSKVERRVHSFEAVEKDKYTVTYRQQKGKNKFSIEMLINGNPAGVFQYDAGSGRTIAELDPEYLKKNFEAISGEIQKEVVAKSTVTASVLGGIYIREKNLDKIAHKLSDTHLDKSDKMQIDKITQSLVLYQYYQH